MHPRNSSQAQPFLLAGLPGTAQFHHWVFLPFGLMYLLAVLGNGTILLVVRVHRQLHQPMYYFLLMLATTDLGLTLSTLPTVLRVFWLGATEISFPACLIQMFCIHPFSFMESSVLLTMAFDRYVAIRCPLSYCSILTSARVAQIGVGIICRCTLSLLPLICLLTWLPFCRSRALSHPYCLHQDIIRLACTDATLNSLYGFTLVLVAILDFVLIALSYVMIFRTVLGIASREERAKALNTRVSHFCAVLIFYIPLAGLSIMHRYGRNAPPISHAVMANVYLFVPPILNPILCSMKSKAICKGLLGLLCWRAAWPGRAQSC
ncbi:olfactory receptor 51A4-like [Lagopus leucura]|uniref:olfactory receptor 51A4-like n=1 Tax=Lagopus leucura TaxID=30410 RepID=UPI001C682F20|nr:olfactory receptor 51A4-like [Lagopus leucura]